MTAVCSSGGRPNLDVLEVYLRSALGFFRDLIGLTKDRGFLCFNGYFRRQGPLGILLRWPARSRRHRDGSAYYSGHGEGAFRYLERASGFRLFTCADRGRRYSSRAGYT